MERPTLSDLNYANMLTGSNSSIKGKGIWNVVIGYDGNINNGTGVSIIGSNENITNSEHSIMIGSTGFLWIKEGKGGSIIGSGRAENSTDINLFSHNFLSTVSNSTNINAIGDIIIVKIQRLLD